MAFRAPSSAPPPAHTFVAPPVAQHNIPPGTLPPGTIVNVGKYRVTVDRYLSEGGFAHVYLASSATPIPAGSPAATTRHVLKRMAVPDQAGVEEVGKEVKVMVSSWNMVAAISTEGCPDGAVRRKGVWCGVVWCGGWPRLSRLGGQSLT